MTTCPNNKYKNIVADNNTCEVCNTNCEIDPSRANCSNNLNCFKCKVGLFKSSNTEFADCINKCPKNTFGNSTTGICE